MTSRRASRADHHNWRLLVVDDDARLRDLLQRYLSGQGYNVEVAQDATDARERLAGIQYDLVVLDVSMPGENGLSLARSLRAHGDIPILFLTARKETKHRIEGLEAGADDYMGKPFNPHELSLRVASLLRRAQPIPLPGWVHFGQYRFDLERRQLWNRSGQVLLTAREGEVLQRLSVAVGEPVSRNVLGQGSTPGERSVDVCINRLRRKLGEDARSARHIVSVRGTGYALRAELL